MLSLDKKNADGLYFAYCPFAFIFDSGSRCAPYHKKFLVECRKERILLTILKVLLDIVSWVGNLNICDVALCVED